MLPLSIFSKYSVKLFSSIDFFNHYSDDKEYKEDFSSIMFGVVKEIIQRGINTGI